MKMQTYHDPIHGHYAGETLNGRTYNDARARADAIEAIINAVGKYRFVSTFSWNMAVDVFCPALEVLGINASTYVVPKTLQQRRDEAIEKLDDPEIIKLLQEVIP